MKKKKKTDKKLNKIRERKQKRKKRACKFKRYSPRRAENEKAELTKGDKWEK